jgi:hypothetical protein
MFTNQWIYDTLISHTPFCTTEVSIINDIIFVINPLLHTLQYKEGIKILEYIELATAYTGDVKISFGQINTTSSLHTVWKERTKEKR